MQNNLTNTSGRMDNPYLSAPALLGLSQHTAGFTEALRMSRTFAHQAAEGKDFSSGAAGGGGFAGGPLALRAFDFHSLPSHLLLGSPFLSGSMDPRLPFSGSAFHPVTSAAAAAAAAAAAFDRKFFSPPAGCSKSVESKYDPAGEYGEVTSTAALAPAAATGRRGEAEDEDRNSTGSDRSSPEDTAAARKCLGVSPADLSSCPVCGASLRPGEVTEHLTTEVERLVQAARGAAREKHSRDGVGWETYLRVRGNRQLRLRCKTRKRRGEEGGDCVGCLGETPLDRLTAPSHHSQQQTPPAKRLAAAAGPGVGEEEEVDVLGDSECNGTDWTGRPADQQRNSSDAAVGGSASPGCEEGVPDTTDQKNPAGGGLEVGEAGTGGAEVEQLRAQVSDLRRQTELCRCRVCGLTLRQPLISTRCWHVHCQPCWTRALVCGRGVCVRCKSDVSADDLKPIHI